METEGGQFPNKLRKYRKLMGYKKVDVARLLGIQSTNRISRWERGLAMPSALNLIRLSILYKEALQQHVFSLYPELASEYHKGRGNHNKYYSKLFEAVGAALLLQHNP